MKEQYVSIYKCRVCGEVYGVLSGIFTSSEALVELSKLRSTTAGLTGLHNCAENVVGISDLQGFSAKKEDENARNK